MILTLLACAASAPGPTCDLSGEHLLVATTDLEVGALAAVVPGTGCMQDEIASIGPDPLVRALDAHVVVADRGRGDGVRIYEPGTYERPMSEFVPEVGGNVHDVVRWGDELLLPLYALPEVVVASLDGTERGRIDLSAHADADGNVEADRVAVAGGRPFVALQRLAAEGSVWLPAGPGRLVELDVGALAAGAAHDVGDNPRLSAHPSDPDAFTVLTGRFFEPDGALYEVVPGTEPGPELLTEAAVGLDLTHAVGAGEHLVVVGVGFQLGDRFRVDCLDLASGELVPGIETDAWPIDAVSGGEGEVFVAVRPNEGAGDSEVWRVDPATCRVDVVASGFVLPPYALAWVEG